MNIHKTNATYFYQQRNNMNTKKTNNIHGNNTIYNYKTHKHHELLQQQLECQKQIHNNKHEIDIFQVYNNIVDMNFYINNVNLTKTFKTTTWVPFSWIKVVFTNFARKERYEVEGGELVTYKRESGGDVVVVEWRWKIWVNKNCVWWEIGDDD